MSEKKNTPFNLFGALTLALFVFAVTTLLATLVGRFGLSLNRIESFVLSLCFSIIVFIIYERWKTLKIITPCIDTSEKQLLSLNDNLLGLTQSQSVNLFFDPVKKLAEENKNQNIQGTWFVLRRDASQSEKFCVYIFKIWRHGAELVFESYDENKPGESYFLNGLLYKIGEQIVLQGHVTNAASMHLYTLFNNTSEMPSYLYGGHYQTTLKGSASIAAPVLFLRVNDSHGAKANSDRGLANTSFLERHADKAKRFDKNHLLSCIENLSGICPAIKTHLSTDEITDFVFEQSQTFKVSDSDLNLQ